MLPFQLTNLINFAAVDVGAAFMDTFRVLLLCINIAIYKLIAFVYNLFEVIASAQFLDNDLIQGLMQRVGLVLGLFMTFKLILSLIQTMINPDDNQIKASGKLVSRIIISIVLLGSVNFIFDEARDLQDIILIKDNVIAKLVLGRSSSSDDNFGTQLSHEVFFTFFTDMEEPMFQGEDYNPENKSELEVAIAGDQCDPYDPDNPDNPNNCMNILKEITTSMSNGSLERTKYVVNSKTKDVALWEAGEYYVEFDGITSIIVGIFMIYILGSYCFSVGVRTIQLAFLQIIAPIPILSNISPKDDTAFSKWTKMCLTTYLDVFIRVAIIYFIVFMIKGLFENDMSSLIQNSSAFSESKLTWAYANMAWVQIILILALLIFAKKAPDLLHEMFPKTTASIGFGTSFKEKFNNMIGGSIISKAVGTTARGAVGAVGAAAIGGVGAAIGNAVYGRVNHRSVSDTIRSTIGGLGSGVARGFHRGFSNGIKGGPVGIWKAGMSGMTAASIARNQRDSTYGMKYGASEKLSNYFSTASQQRKELGAAGEFNSKMSQLKAQIAREENSQSNFEDAINESMKSIPNLRGALGYDYGTGKYTVKVNYNDYLDTQLSANGFSSRTAFETEISHRAYVNHTTEAEEANAMLAGLGIANAAQFQQISDLVTDHTAITEQLKADRTTYKQMEGTKSTKQDGN